MKTLLATFFMLLTVTVVSHAKPQPYYWVVETSTCKNNFSIIRIYDTEHQLIYTEQVAKTLDITDKKVNRKLFRKARKLTALKERL